MDAILDTTQHLALMLRDRAKLMGDDHLASEIYTKAADKLLKLEQKVLVLCMLVPNRNEDVVRVLANMLTDSQEAIRNTTLREAARIARNVCLVPPDGGSPTEMADRVFEAIMELVNDAT